MRLRSRRSTRAASRDKALRSHSKPRGPARIPLPGAADAAVDCGRQFPGRAREAARRSANEPPADVNFRKTARDRHAEEHTSELQSHSELVCRLLLEKKTANSRCVA